MYPYVNLKEFTPASELPTIHPEAEAALAFANLNRTYAYSSGCQTCNPHVIQQNSMEGPVTIAYGLHHLRSVSPATVLTRASTSTSVELEKSITPPPKPSVKRELCFETPDTPKKAKAPVPTRKVISCVVKVKTEEAAPTAAKSKTSPPVGAVPPPVLPKNIVPPSKSPAPIPAVVPKPVPSMKKELAPTIPPEIPSKPIEPSAQQRTAQQEKAASLRRMQPLSETGSNVSPASNDSSVMAERRRNNKMQDMTDEDILTLQLEEAIIAELVQKTDDEIDAMFENILKHPLFPKFAQEQRDEAGLEDWEFDDVEQIPMWEIWVQKQTHNQPVAPSATPKPSKPVVPKALSITPPPSSTAAKASTPAKASIPAAKAPVSEPPVVPKHVVTPKPASPPPPKAVSTANAAPLTTPAAPKPVVAKQPAASACASQSGTAFGITLKDASTVTCQ